MRWPHPRSTLHSRAECTAAADLADRMTTAGTPNPPATIKLASAKVHGSTASLAVTPWGA